MKYTYLSQDIKLPEHVEGKVHNNNNQLSAGLTLGYRTAFDNWFLEPSIQLVTGHIDSVEVNGLYGSRVALASQTPFITKSGIQTGYKLKDATVSVGLFHEKNWRANQAQVIVQDAVKSRSYGAPDNNRYIANISVDGNLTKSLNMYGRVESSFNGNYTTDFLGQVGIRYSF